MNPVHALFETTDVRFASDVLRSELPVLVDFWAEWCAPCKAIAPLLEDLSKVYASRLRIAKLDAGLHPATAARYQVRNLPTLLLFKNGVVVASKTGAVGRKQLVEFLDKELA